MDARHKEDLSPVDVAYACGDSLIQERVGDRAIGPPQPLEEDALSGARRNGIRAQTVENRLPLFPTDDLAGRRPDQIPRRTRGRQAHADRRPGGGSRGSEAVEIAEHPEVNMHDRPVAPVVKEMFSPRLRALEDLAVEAPGLPGKTRLRDPDSHAATREIPILLASEAVKNRPFGHVNRPAGRARPG